MSGWLSYVLYVLEVAVLMLSVTSMLSVGLGTACLSSCPCSCPKPRSARRSSPATGVDDVAAAGSRAAHPRATERVGTPAATAADTPVDGAH